MEDQESEEIYNDELNEQTILELKKIVSFLSTF